MNKKIIAIIFAIIIASFSALYYNKKKDSSAPKHSEYIVSPKDIGTNILSTGEVKPRNRLEIKPSIAGRIEEVLVNEGQIVKKGDRLAWMSSTERAALIDAARSRGPEEVERWGEFYRPTAIISPIDGMVIARNIEPGQSFSTQDILFVMSDTLAVKALVDETDLADIRLGQAATIILDAYPQRPIDAIVEHIAFESKTVNNVTNYEVDVIPLNTVEQMRSGMTANISFNLEKRENVLAIPTTAVQTRGPYRFVLKKTATSPLGEEVSVEVGLDDGRLSEIKKGLSEGDTILVPTLSGPSALPPTQGSPFQPQRRRR